MDWINEDKEAEIDVSPDDWEISEYQIDVECPFCYEETRIWTCDIPRGENTDVRCENCGAWLSIHTGDY